MLTSDIINGKTKKIEKGLIIEEKGIGLTPNFKTSKKITDVSTASASTEMEDIFKLNMNITIQLNLENLGFLKNLEIAIQSLDSQTKDF